MTDYFALLGQPRRPWLDPVALQQAFHALTLRAHPDAMAGKAEAADAEAGFARINEAYRVLQDPKRRLQHLLNLEGHPPSSAGGQVPEEIAEIFPTVAAVTQDAERAQQRAAVTTNPLSRSLLRGEFLQAGRRIDEALVLLLRLRTEAESDLERLNALFAKMAPGDRFSALHRVYLRFSYLTRWIDQLEEKRTQLAEG
jgi:curved DNA-binding protein CbpA